MTEELLHPADSQDNDVHFYTWKQPPDELEGNDRTLRNALEFLGLHDRSLLAFPTTTSTSSLWMTRLHPSEFDHLNMEVVLTFQVQTPHQKRKQELPFGPPADLLQEYDCPVYTIWKQTTEEREDYRPLQKIAVYSLLCMEDNFYTQLVIPGLVEFPLTTKQIRELPVFSNRVLRFPRTNYTTPQFQTLLQCDNWNWILDYDETLRPSTRRLVDACQQLMNTVTPSKAASCHRHLLINASHNDVWFLRSLRMSIRDTLQPSSLSYTYGSRIVSIMLLNTYKTLKSLKSLTFSTTRTKCFNRYADLATALRDGFVQLKHLCLDDTEVGTDEWSLNAVQSLDQVLEAVAAHSSLVSFELKLSAGVAPTSGQQLARFLWSHGNRSLQYVSLPARSTQLDDLLAFNRWYQRRHDKIPPFSTLLTTQRERPSVIWSVLNEQYREQVLQQVNISERQTKRPREKSDVNLRPLTATRML